MIKTGSSQPYTKWILLPLLVLIIAGCGKGDGSRANERELNMPSEEAQTEERRGDERQPGGQPVEESPAEEEQPGEQPTPDDQQPGGQPAGEPPAEEKQPGGQPAGEPPVEESPVDEPQVELPELAFAGAFGGMRFDTPVGLQHAGDGSGRLFVVEQPGRILMLGDRSDKPERTVFLDMADIVNDSGWEQGLLGLAFHPEYGSNGKFYVNYTAERTTVIAEYKKANDAERADPQSARKLLEFDQPYDNHNGGELAFGPDGYLYIAVGDGGSGGDPRGNGQNRETLLGTILRIDVNQPSGELAYTIPQDNPFVGNTEGYREEIYAYGLRNPWRFSFDPVTGLLWAADVGQNKVEEINLIQKGNNYGWNVMEGSICYHANTCPQDGLTLPIWEYEPAGRGASVTGGYVYRGNDIPGLAGRYIFADFIDGRVWTLSYDGESGAEAEAEQLELRLPGITSFGVDEAGEIYACLYDGTIMRLAVKK